MRTSCVLFLAFVVVAAASGQTAPQSTGRQADKAQIRRIESDWSEAGATGKCVEKEILANEFLGTSVAGKRYTKADKVAECRSKGADMVYDHLDKIEMRFFGDVAVAWGSEIWKRKNGKSGRYVWTDVLVKHGGRWKIVAAQDAIPVDLE